MSMYSKYLLTFSYKDKTHYTQYDVAEFGNIDDIYSFITVCERNDTYEEFKPTYISMVIKEF